MKLSVFSMIYSYETFSIFQDLFLWNFQYFPGFISMKLSVISRIYFHETFSIFHDLFIWNFQYFPGFISIKLSVFSRIYFHETFSIFYKLLPYNFQYFPWWVIPSSDPWKVTILGFWSKKMRNVLKLMKKQISDFCDF